MKEKTTKHTDVSATQTVTGDLIKVLTGGETIQIGFTGKKITGHAGAGPFIAYLHRKGVPKLLRELMPQPRSNNGKPAEEVALGFITGILLGAKKLAQVAFLRSDSCLPKLLQIESIASQSTLSRFFARFNGSAVNLRSLTPLWQWGLQQLASRAEGYTLDLDSTQLVHDDHKHAQGVRVGHTPQGLKGCLNPLLAFLAEAHLVAGFWLRPGNTHSFNNVVSFTLWILSLLPKHVRIGLVRADSGFCLQEWLDLLESQRLSYIVVGKLHEPVRNLLRREQAWMETEVAGTDVSETLYQGPHWPRARRVILVRHREIENKRSGGKKLLDVPGYRFQILLTNLGSAVSPLTVWRRYNGRADSENVIKELDRDFAIPQLCLEKFWSTEAALSLAIVSYNLCRLFQRFVGWTQQLTATTLRFRLFTTGGLLSRTANRVTLKLAAPPHQRSWWKSLFEKVLSPFPNCNAVEPWPPCHPSIEPLFT